MSKEYSIIIVSYNCLEDLKACLDSVKSHSDGRSEIIVVENHSSDGSADYLNRLNDITVIQNPGNHGFARACNTGAARASGDYLVFLNPDTLVTHGWLDHMRLFFRNPEVAAVGPVSTYVAGLQKVELHTRERLKSIANLPFFSEALYLQNRGKGVETRLLIGFCFMVRTELFRMLGGMDEALFLGNDDLDLSWRLRNLGHKLVVATDTLIFHQGQRSFQSEPGATVSRLVQASTDTLYEKLVNHYGSPEKVPPPEEIWGMNWFNPSPQIISRLSGKSKPVRGDGASSGLAWLVYIPPDLSEQGPVLSTLDSIPEAEAHKILLVNHNTRFNLTPTGFKGTRLDIPPQKPLKAVLEMGLNLIGEEKLLFLISGVEISGFLTLRLGELVADNELSAIGLPLSVASTQNEKQAPFVDCRAFLCQTAWFRKILADLKETGLFDNLTELLRQSPPPRNPSPLTLSSYRWSRCRRQFQSSK